MTDFLRLLTLGSEFDDFGSLEPLVRFTGLILYLVAFFERFETLAVDAGKVDENILPSAFLRDETKALFVVKPLDDTLFHTLLLPSIRQFFRSLIYSSTDQS
jgi:hypothetical protein